MTNVDVGSQLEGLCKVVERNEIVMIEDRLRIAGESHSQADRLMQ